MKPKLYNKEPKKMHILVINRLFGGKRFSVGKGYM